MIIMKFKRSFAYALNGNLIQKKIIDPDTDNPLDTWDYSCSNHAATNISTTEHGVDRFIMQYNAVGNMITQTDYQKNLSKTINYDSQNRIKEAYNPDADVVVGSYWYDGQDFRVRRISRREIDASYREFEIVYPSKYFCTEVQRNDNGIEMPDSYCVVNNIFFKWRACCCYDTKWRRFILLDRSGRFSKSSG